MTAIRGAVLLTRPDCHLCEEFLDELAAAFPELAAQLALEDVDSRLDWRMEYGRRIPVLLDGDGRVLCERQFDAARLRADLR
jgi:hypothetical protein